MGHPANIKLIENTSKLERELEMHNLHYKIALQKCVLDEKIISNLKNANFDEILGCSKLGTFTVIGIAYENIE